jgi:hypothetical protein
VLVTLNQFNETQEMAKSRARELKKKLWKK